MAKRRRRWRYEQGLKPRDPRLWLYGRVPAGFWQSSENRHLYLDWLGKQLGFTQPEDWYHFTGRHLQQRHGWTLRGNFGGSPLAILKDYLPQYDWKEWLFVSAPQRFWQNPANRRRYLDWLGKQLGFRRVEDWYRISCEDFAKWHGAGLLANTGDSPVAALKEYRPQYEWLEWRFSGVPKGFWDDPANHRRYLDWLGKQLGFRRPEDWSQLTRNHLRQWHGSRLLDKFRTPSRIVKEYLAPRASPRKRVKK
ncbi:MAG: hypothetical protein ACRERD_13830 [Candidatus Binatia bacterium]